MYCGSINIMGINQNITKLISNQYYSAIMIICERIINIESKRETKKVSLQYSTLMHYILLVTT